MELAHSLLLNEEALTKIPDAKRPVFIFEWLRFLDKVLIAAQKVKVWVFTSCDDFFCCYITVSKFSLNIKRCKVD